MAFSTPSPAWAAHPPTTTPAPPSSPKASTPAPPPASRHPVRNPRTAAGVSEDGQTLVLMVIDGRQPGWSEGVTLPQLADLMIEFDAHNAVNLDGGGSSSFVYDDNFNDDQLTHENRPSDGAHRPVANHLGVRINQTQSLIPQEDRRRIRGVWRRPPSSLTQLESEMDQLVDAGVQDLFLETFYWGLATNDSDIFNDRFSFDYLEEAIRRAHRYGLRVHAWLESAYWSFSGTGNYILNQHPEWKVVDYQGNTNIGDIPGQVFVNLMHPGVQSMLGDYCAELATNYPGLWGIQTDYHRFPLDNNTGDTQRAPYSYDDWSRAQFIQQAGFDPINFGSNPSGPLWDAFIEFRRDGIAQAANVMNTALSSADPGLQFTGAIFASAITSSSQLVKMQDWPQMAREGYLPYVVPMAYSTSTAGIRSDIQTANNDKGPANVVAGLAILTNTTRPTITQQLDTIYNESVNDFIFFESSVITGSSARQSELAGYLTTNGPYQTADLDNDHDVDALDWAAFFAVYQGQPIPAGGILAPPGDLNNDDVIDADDEHRFLQQFRAFRFGADATVNAKDIAALEAARTPASAAATAQRDHLYDLNGDNAIDDADLLRLHTLLTEPVEPDLDTNRDGTIDINDLYFQTQSPRDINRDGTINQTDNDTLEAALRANELQDMQAGN
jgi:uncharacterized lipoprotein YddW (UPF0748 family)